MVFGDSLTYSIEHGPGWGFNNQFLTDELVANGYSASISSWIGATTRDLPAVAPQVPAPGADIMVIALGSNDMRVNATTGTTAVPLAEALGHITTAIDEVGASCNVLVTVAETEPWGLDTSAPTYNETLRNLPNVIIADWAPLVAANPDFVVGTDGVHLTPAGSDAYRALFHVAIDSCLSVP